VITIPAATAGLYAVAREATTGLDYNLLSVFWEGFRGRWRRATLLWLLDAGVTAMLLYDAWFFLSIPGWMQVLTGIALSLLLILLLVNLYAWPLLIATDWGLGRLLKLSLMLAGVHLFRSLGVALLVIALGAAGLQLPLLLPVALPGAVALLSTYNAARVLRRYLPADGSEAAAPPDPQP